jgi:HAE1 family hydrophobic/amphiphilic exporter-1
VSGALVGIALVLSSVFIPAAFIAGITGSLYRQFALTIAFSVLISAFNALTLSPAARRADPPSPGEGRAPLDSFGRFFSGFDRAFAAAQTGYVRACGFLIRKVVVALVLLAAFTALAGGLGKILPTSFMPQEDQGFFFMNVQLPEAASMQRTNAVMRKIDEILKAEPGVHYVNAVSGYSLLSQTASPRNGLYFVQLDARTTSGRRASSSRTRSSPP